MCRIPGVGDNDALSTPAPSPAWEEELPRHEQPPCCLHLNSPSSPSGYSPQQWMGKKYSPGTWGYCECPGLPLATQRGLGTLVRSQNVLLPPVLLQPGWAGRAPALRGTFLEIAGFIFSRSTAALGWEGMDSGGVGGQHGVDGLPLPRPAPALAERGWTPLQRCWPDPGSFGCEGGDGDVLRGAPLLLARARCLARGEAPPALLNNLTPRICLSQSSHSPGSCGETGAGMEVMLPQLCGGGPGRGG